MGIRAEYEVRKLPPTFKTVEAVYTFEEIKNGRRNRYGELPQRMVAGEQESSGGWIIAVKGKPGHSIRISSIDQARVHKLKVIDGEIVPRLIDEMTGEEVNERGIPLSVEKQLNATADAIKNANGHVETDVDVQTSADVDLIAAEFDAEGERLLRNPSAGEAAIADQIAETE